MAKFPYNRFSWNIDMEQADFYSSFGVLLETLISLQQ